MPADISRTDTVADIDRSNLDPLLVHDEAPGDGRNESDADFKASGKASSGMASNRNPSTSFTLTSEDITNRPGASSKNGRHTSQDGLLQIPSDGGAARPPATTTSVWVWDAPLGERSVGGDNSSYYYEPQGELLQEQREQRSSRTEFSIPHAVSGSGLHWPFPASAVGPGSNDGFAVPRRPSGVPPSIAGNKRKSTSDREALSGGKQPELKRSSRSMNDSGEEPSSPSDVRPPAHSTRSQAPQPGPTNRVRSATDSVDGRPRPLGTELEPGRAGAGASGSGPRRNLSDPLIPTVLPARKVFPIQIGDKLFRLSGASISSDGESIVSDRIMSLG